jgi:Tfp pilus assembly protein PilF
MQRRTRKLLIICVLIPGILAAAAGGAFVFRKQQISRGIAQAGVDGKAAFQAGRYAEALPLLGRYAGRNRQDTDAMLMLAECRALVPKPEGGEVAEAARYAEAVLSTEPRNKRALELLMGFYTKLNFVTELNRVCDTLLEIDPQNAAALTAKSRASLVLGKYNEAAAFAERLAESRPGDADPFRLVLEARRLQGATPAQLAVQAGEFAAKHAASFELHVIHVQTLLGAENVPAATDALIHAGTLTPGRLRALGDFLRLADALAGLGRIPGAASQNPTVDFTALAERVAERCFANASLADTTPLIAAAWHWRGGRVADAERWIARGLERAPTNAGQLAFKSIMARSSGASASAPAPSVTADDANPSGWPVLLDGLDKLSRGQAKLALASFEALALDASRTLDQSTADAETADAARAEATEQLLLATLYAADAHVRLGDWRVAVRKWESLAESDPMWSLPVLLSARTLLENRQTAAAYDAASRAVRIRSGSREALMLAEAAVARQEDIGAPGNGDAVLMPLLKQLDTLPELRPSVLPLRARLSILKNSQATLDAEIAAMIASQPPVNADVLTAVAQRARAAGLDGWSALLDAAEKQGGGTNAVVARAIADADAGNAPAALAAIRAAITARSGLDLIPLRLQEARLLAATGASDDAKSVLRALSEQYPDNAAAQFGVLENPITWTDAALAQAAVARLRNSTGDNAVEWKLAEATRLLTFAPEPAKAQESVLQLTQILRDDPRNAQASMLLADWMGVLNDPNAAIEHLSRAADMPDAPPVLHARLIGLLQRAGRQDEARRRLDQFAAMTNLRPEALRARARLLAEFGMRDQARQDLETLASAGDPDDRLALAAALISDGRAAEAILPVEEVLAGPQLTRDRFLRAVGMLIDLGQVDRGLAMVDERADATNEQVARQQKADLLERARRFDEAEALYRANAEPAGDEDAVSALAGYYMRRSEHAKARQVLAAAAARGLRTPALDSLDALAAANTDASLSEAQQQAVIEGIPPGPTRDLAEAAKWYDANPTQRQEFITRLVAITGKDPTLLLAWRLMVQAHSELGQFDQAADAARRAARSLPTSPDAARLESAALLSAGRIDDARTAAARWRTLLPDPLEAELLLAQIEVRAGRADAARATLDPIAARANTASSSLSPQALLDALTSYAAIGDVPRARSLAALGPTSDPQWTSALASVAGNTAEPPAAAREWLGTLAPLMSKSPQGAVALAEARAAIGFRSKDRADFVAALELIESRLGDADAPAGLQIFGATLMSEVDREPDAEKLYRRVLTQDPTRWIASNNLAYLLVRRTPPDPASLALAAAAAEGAEKTGAGPAARASTLQTLALAQLRSGNASDALATIKRAIAFDPNAVEARVTEAEALLASGDPQRARAAAQSVLRDEEAKPGKLTTFDETRIRQVLERTAQ